MQLAESFMLRDGNTIPAVGFGTWQAKPNEVENAVKIALQSGYRHIDCAAIYRNEAEVGDGIRDSGVPRNDIFLTSKLWTTHHRPEHVEKALNKTLSDLGTEYLDLYLMHWPVAFRAGEEWFPLDAHGVFDLDREVGVEATWAAMVRLLSTGKVKSIGVCNFNTRRLKELLGKTEHVPVVNQVEAHPYLQQRELFGFCKSHNILIQAYSPLGNNQSGEPKTLDDPKVQKLAKDLGKDGGQLLASWGVQRGTVVLPKERDGNQNSHVQASCGNPAHWGFDIFEEVGNVSVRKAALAWAEANRNKSA